MFAQIIPSKVSSFTDKIYTYSIPIEFLGKVKIGQQVVVPFGKRKIIGYIIGITDSAPENIKEIKPILEIRELSPIFSADDVGIAKWISNYYISYFGLALRLFLPPGISSYEKNNSKKRLLLAKDDPSIEVFGNCFCLPQIIENGFHIKNIKDKIDCRENFEILLNATGKKVLIDIYIDLIDFALSKNKGAIILLPELTFDDPIANIFKEKFGNQLSILHSFMSLNERHLEWEKIYCGKTNIVLGTRSALFSPVKNLGLVIIDEEEEFTYKQEKSPKYHARDAAKYLCKIKSIPLIMGSGSPSIEVFFEAKKHNSTFIIPSESARPEISIIDMRKKDPKDWGVLSDPLLKEIGGAISKKEQVVLFINRRGYYPLSICRTCGEIIKCNNCSALLAYHSKDKKMLCHKCGISQEYPFACPKCLGSSINLLGVGTQKVESEIAKHFPHAKIMRLDKDAVSKKSSYELIIRSFVQGNADILIGTQMCLRALDFKSIYLVGVVSADTSLNVPNFRSCEDTFALLSQACGFALRYHRPQKVIIQTYNPEHYSIASINNGGYCEFYDMEILNRKEFNYPPFRNLINIAVSSTKQDLSLAAVNEIAEKLKIISPHFEVLGPMQISAKHKGETRYQILIKGWNLDIIKDNLREILAGISKKDISVSIDVDPIEI